jgi:hypothetical protein
MRAWGRACYGVKDRRRIFENPRCALDSTRIIVRRGSSKVGEQVRAALGLGKVEIDLDSSKLLDVSVLLGADFAPPRSTLDFHP